MIQSISFTIPIMYRQITVSPFGKYLFTLSTLYDPFHAVKECP